MLNPAAKLRRRPTFQERLERNQPAHTLTNQFATRLAAHLFNKGGASASPRARELLEQLKGKIDYNDIAPRLTLKGAAALAKHIRPSRKDYLVNLGAARALGYVYGPVAAGKILRRNGFVEEQVYRSIGPAAEAYTLRHNLPDGNVAYFKALHKNGFSPAQIMILEQTKATGRDGPADLTSISAHMAAAGIPKREILAALKDNETHNMRARGIQHRNLSVHFDTHLETAQTEAAQAIQHLIEKKQAAKLTHATYAQS
ncbi:MAG: hypothetical protein V1722_02440 [Candidatus Micrarchaeota archaeon]